MRIMKYVSCFVVLRLVAAVQVIHWELHTPGNHYPSRSQSTEYAERGPNLLRPRYRPWMDIGVFLQVAAQIRPVIDNTAFGLT